MALALVVPMALGLAACSRTGTTATSTTGDLPAPTLSPVQEATAWFRTINSHSLKAELAHFEPQQKFMGNWDGGNVAMWGHFEGVKCGPPPPRNTAASVPTGSSGHAPTTLPPSTDTSVLCTFHFVPSPGGDSSAVNDTFWNVHFHRSHDGPWLIDNYGQG
jgi:hypothetical protein